MTSHTKIPKKTKTPKSNSSKVTTEYYSLFCLRTHKYATYPSGQKILLPRDVSDMLKAVYVQSFLTACRESMPDLLVEEIVLNEETIHTT